MNEIPRVPIVDCLQNGYRPRAPDADEEVWCLNLDQLESHSGKVIGRLRVPVSELGPSTHPFEQGTVLYSKLRPYLNKVVVADEDGVATTELVPLRCDDTKVDASYLAHFLRGPEFLRFATNVVSGAKMPRMVMSEFWKYGVPLPPLSEQRRIAAILDQADALRHQRREALAELDRLAEAVFADMFGSHSGSQSQFTKHTVNEVCERITVGVVVQPASYYQETGVPALRSLNVRRNRIDPQNLVYFSERDNEATLAKSRVWAGDVLLVRTGQPGTAAVVPRALSGCNAIDILILTPRTGLVCSEYLARFFNSTEGRNIVLGSQRGQIQQHLNVASVRAAPIPIPPISLQECFAERISQIDTLIAAQKRALAEMDALFASLQHRAFTGAL